MSITRNLDECQAECELKSASARPKLVFVTGSCLPTTFNNPSTRTAPGLCAPGAFGLFPMSCWLYHEALELSRGIVPGSG